MLKDRANMLRLSALAAFMLLIGCGPDPAVPGAAAQEPADFLTLVEAPPYPPIERLGPEPTQQTIEQRRWLFEQRVEERQLPLLRRIKSGEMGNFGGVEWRWREGPQNGKLGELTGIVYFLREPAGTLARYTRDPLFRPAQGGFARTEQERIVRHWAETIGRERASEAFANMRVPTLHLAIPRAEFERQAQAQGWRLPANLELRFDPRAEPDLPSVAANLQPLIRAFPHQPHLSGPTPDIATFDAIVLRKGCFFIDEAGEEDPLAEFPFGVGVYRDGEGFVAFRFRRSEDRRRLGRVGTRLQLGYRSAPRAAPPDLARVCGARSIVTVTSVDQAAGYGAAWHAVRDYRDREGIGTAEAIRRANACLLAEERVMADARLRSRREVAAACPDPRLLGYPVPPPPPPLPPPATKKPVRG